MWRKAMEEIRNMAWHPIHVTTPPLPGGNESHKKLIKTVDVPADTQTMYHPHKSDMLH
jgi:hypothetical protein